VVRPAIDQYLHDYRQSRRVTDLRRAAHTDPLTGLGNRRALNASVPVGDYAVISLDLDHFKQVNDLFGHPAGDAVLSQVAGVLAGAIRDSDAAYRLGGEEFLLVLRDAHADLAHLIADRIRTRVAELDLDGQAPDGRITVSMGLVTVTQGSSDVFAEALEAADAALYASKQSGRDRLTIAARVAGQEWGADASSEAAV
jgi:diguanylate cyclase (GGDEF)-like protein